MDDASTSEPAPSTPYRGDPHGSPRRRFAVVAALAVVPWTVILIYGEVTLVFPFGFLNTNPPELIDTYTLLVVAKGGLPRNPELLPLSILFYLVALASAGAGLVGREDPRFTAGLLVLAGGSHLGVAYAFSHRLAYTPVPFGAVIMFAVAWWYYWPSLRATVMAPVE
ncbi:TIGR04206 family protein [Haloglomus litoreum]|uniref:TIGR04206 family protein n=1 Tax=Haloglomus litoreum TaxID=3034026 RepID=UPI0023E832E7|nr:TIGR04206 family protein [Haloglomus sp. DT116]